MEIPFDAEQAATTLYRKAIWNSIMNLEEEWKTESAAPAKKQGTRIRQHCNLAELWKRKGTDGHEEGCTGCGT